MRRFDPRVAAGRQVLVVAPHPDDEAVGCGGTVALLAAAGATVRVAILVRGEGGIDPGAAPVTPEQRRGEARASCQALGCVEPLFLGLRSEDLRADPAGAGRSLAGALGRASADLLLVPWPLERHATHRAGLLAGLHSGVARIGAAWWGWGAWDALPAWDDVAEVDVTGVRVAKTQAIRAHRSQDRPRGLAAAALARDAAQAAFSRLSGPEERKAVERLIDLSPLVRELAGVTDGPAVAAAVGAWCARRSAAWAAALWTAGGDSRSAAN